MFKKSFKVAELCHQVTTKVPKEALPETAGRLQAGKDS